MDPLKRHSPHSPSLDASYVDGTEHSAPPTPLSPTSSTQLFYNASQTDGNHRLPTYASPTVTSPAKPSKRKRLAKACDACHRSKRRCDGTSPCSNCDFAGKPCTYTDPSGRAVAPPRTRSVDLRPGQFETWPYPIRNGYAKDNEQLFPSGALPVPTMLDPSPSPLDARVTRELVNLFFAQCHPATLIIHRSSFLIELSRSQVPPYLLLAILALAAPYSLQPSIRNGASRSWRVGERFAIQAASTILDLEHALDPVDSIDRLRVRPCLELAQALCLLQVHDSVMRRSSEPNRFMPLAQKVLQEIGVMNMDQNMLVSTLDDHLRNEAMRRTFWFIYYIGVLSCAFAHRPPPIVSDESNRLRLPVEEALFDLPRVDNRPSVHSFHDYLQLPVENKPCRGEFANLIRVTRIYAGVISAANQKIQSLQAWDTDHVKNAQMPSVASLEVGLRRWLELLPDCLRLTQENLGTQLSQLDGGAGAGAWAFLYMHALAETTVLALEEFTNIGTPPKGLSNLSLREQKALENLTMILGALGQRGRANITMAPFLIAIGKHFSPQDPPVASWFDEYFRMWGVTYEQLMNVQFRASWCTIGSDLLAPHFLVDGASSQIGPDFDYDMDFGALENTTRRLSNSSSSGTEQSIAATRGLDGSTAAQYFGLNDESQLMRDLGEPSGPLGGLQNGVVSGLRLVGEEMGAERLGAFIGERASRERLPALDTDGLTGRGGLGLNNAQSQTAGDSISIANRNMALSIQSQGRYGSGTSPHSTSSYTSQTVDDTIDGLGWLANGTKMQ